MLASLGSAANLWPAAGALQRFGGEEFFGRLAALTSFHEIGPSATPTAAALLIITWAHREQSSPDAKRIVRMLVRVSVAATVALPVAVALAMAAGVAVAASYDLALEGYLAGAREVVHIEEVSRSLAVLGVNLAWVSTLALVGLQRLNDATRSLSVKLVGGWLALVCARLLSELLLSSFFDFAD